MLNIYLKVTTEKNWCSQSFSFLSLQNSSPGQFHSSHPHLDDGECLSHFSESLHRKGLGQIRTLGKNWQFMVGVIYSLDKKWWIEIWKKNFDKFSRLVPYPKNFLAVFLKIRVLFKNDVKSGNVCSIVWE